MTTATLTRAPERRPARRRFRHDVLTCVDLFSGFGGLTLGIEAAGFTAITAANHNAYKVEVHEANHPHVDHYIADLVNPESSDYYSAADLPAADLLVAGVSCVNHSQANTKKAYAQGLSLFDLDDPEWEERVTRSERDRATATCVLQYADAHHPRMILVECTTELTSWGPALPGRRKIGDGTTYRWWLRQFENLGYGHRTLYLNSMFFGVPQSRDRLYIIMWDKSIKAPNLDHTPPAWCTPCNQLVESVWTWKTGIPPTGSVRYGKQYNYRCPRCHREVHPEAMPSIYALDFTDLGQRIGDRKRSLAQATMARAERCRQRFGEFPAVLMPAKAVHGTERHPWQPMATQTSQQETALLSTAAIMQMANGYEHPGSECRTRDVSQPLWTQPASPSVGMLTPGAAAIANFQGAPRAADEPLPTQCGSETLGLLTGQVMAAHRHNGDGKHVSQPMDTGSGGLGILSSGIIPFRKNSAPRGSGEPMPTVTAQQAPGMLTAAGRVQCNGSIDEAAYRTYPLDRPLGTVVGSAITQGLLFSGWYKSNGSTGTETAPHPVLDPFGTLTSRDTTTLLTAEWRETLASIALEDCYFRMLGAHEVGRGCGFDVTFGGYQGSFKVWGSARKQIDGYGNAVSPQVGMWLGVRMRAVLHGVELVA